MYFVANLLMDADFNEDRNILKSTNIQISSISWLTTAPQLSNYIIPNGDNSLNDIAASHSKWPNDIQD